ncbi:MAG: aminotransferase class V-fold PLP-dependent enzyme [Clostridia bacterium]|nr:aminotransferase class V-fold PLP-dependent enzyme [Clostridia bacterium]
MIYFDNSATGYKKPDQVIESTVNALKYLSVNAGRSSHKLSLKGEEFIYKTRKEIANFFGSKFIQRVIFTKNCTEALNIAILGSLTHGDHVITSVYEHNSVLRPLYHLQEKGIITLSIVKPERGNMILESDISKAINPKTKMVCLTSASNVTGEISDYEAIGALLSKKNILFLVDGAQGAGHIHIDVTKHNIDLLCVAGHKGLDATQGVGCLIFNKKVDIKPLTFGGSGSETFAKIPSGYPELLECGTLNLPSIISLYEGVLYTKEILSKKQKHLIKLTGYTIDKLSKIPGVKIYSHQNPIGIVSFSYYDYFSQEIAGVLSDKYDIAVRGGFHCAPLTHEFLNTKERGLVRLSFSQFNTLFEIDQFIYALSNIKEYLC